MQCNFAVIPPLSVQNAHVLQLSKVAGRTINSVAVGVE